jgi:hypothetical protein
MLGAAIRACEQSIFPVERDGTDGAFDSVVLKGSRLRLVRSMERNCSGSPMCSIHCTGKSSRWWTGAAPGERTAFISMMTRAG